jgi:DNA repair ATPase RecN
MYACRYRDIDMLKKKLEQQLQQLENANRDKENLEHEHGRLNNELMVRVAKKN